jgi:large subunit ribosomal protein L2
MGKRIIQQARGKGSSTYRVRKSAFKYKLQFPSRIEYTDKKAIVTKLLNSSAHSCPLAKISYMKNSFYIPAFNLMFEKQQIPFDGESIVSGAILPLEKIPVKTRVYCVESRPGDGGKFIKTGGNSGIVTRKVADQVFVLMPSKKEKSFNKKAKAVIGEISGEGRMDKPLMKAGKMFYIKKSKSKLYPRTSAIKVNAIDHPFGSGRGKVPKSKIAKRNSSPGQKVGLLRPRQTGKRK